MMFQVAGNILIRCRKINGERIAVELLVVFALGKKQ
jgi:hypothetical protein